MSERADCTKLRRFSSFGASTSFRYLDIQSGTGVAEVESGSLGEPGLHCPLLIVAPGTGLAPARALLQDRALARRGDPGQDSVRAGLEMQRRFSRYRCTSYAKNTAANARRIQSPLATG